MSSQKLYHRHQALLGKRPSLLMALEPRILFDGAGAEVLADMSADAFLPQESGPAPDAVEPADTGPADAPATDNDVVDAAPLATPELSGQEQGSSNADLVQPDNTASTAESSALITSTLSEIASPADSTVAETAAETSADPGVATSANATADVTVLSGLSPAEDTELASDILQPNPIDPLPTTPISQVVFVDTAVKDYQTLVDGVISSTDTDLADTNPSGTVGSSRYTVSGSALVVTLGENALDDISATLANYTDLAAIHLVSHGDTGEVQIGGIAISEQNLDQYTVLFESMGSSLSESGDLLLYGSNSRYAL